MYNYETYKPKIFTDEGQKDFIKILKHVTILLKKSGAVRMIEAISPVCGDGWYAMALVDRMVELGEIKELTGPKCQGQHRVFIAAK